TLTLGIPEVTTIRTLNGATQDEVLQTAAIAEQHSEHPLGDAIVRRARERNLQLREYANLRYSPGKGLSCEDNGSEILVGSRALFEERGVTVPAEFDAPSATTRATGQTTVLVGRDKRLLGAVMLADQLRAEAKQAVSELKRLGFRTVLLTGDSYHTAEAIGNTLGVHEAIGDLLPEQKLEKIRDLLKRGNKVVMVGDGVNDAPALAEATVGVAMGQGTDVALETADVTLMTSDLSRLVEVLAISKRCYRVIMFNFWGTILVDTIGIGLAFFGLLAPIVAALIHVGSELAFILNSARLFRQKATLGG
ncbi:MAG: heavy metal translocating P-type ATPase, partial [Limisphaerales bacterium]